jgi:uncharacterized protein (TIGR00369 family)
VADFTPRSPDYEAAIRTLFHQQPVMATFGAALTSIAPGAVEITLPFRADLTQQNGFIHAGVLTTLADNACGCAAYSLMPVGDAILTVEYKVNFVRPAAGERLVARGRVIRPGRTVTACAADVFAITGDQETLVATMLATMIALRDRAERAGGD